MFKNKIASLEGRIARLELRISSINSNPTYEEYLSYLGNLEKYLSSYFEYHDRFQFVIPKTNPYPPKIIGYEYDMGMSKKSDIVITAEAPFLKIDVNRAYSIREKNCSKKIITDFFDYSESSFDDVRVALMSCIRQVHKP